MTQDRATWEDIPPEILEQILVHLDKGPLLAMGQVNHVLNRMSLERYFGRAMVNRILNDSEFTTSRTSPRAAVSALCSALWIKNLRHIDHLVMSDAPHLIKDVRSLARFISRMPTSSLITLRLEFIAYGNPLSPLYRGPDMTLKYWSEALEELLDAASSRGCQSFAIEGRFEAGILPVINHLSSAASTSLKQEVILWVGQQVSPILKWPLAPRRPAKIVAGAAKSNLDEFIIASPVLLQPPVLFYTIEILTRHAQTLRHLEFCSSNLELISQNLWDEFLGAIYLPSLESFLWDGLQSEMRPDILAQFLSRHPTITTLMLGTLFNHNQIFPPRGDQPLMPSVRTLEAQDRVIAWLLSQPDVAHPNIQSICIVPSTRASSMLDIFEDCLLGLSALPHPLTTLTIDLDNSSRWWRSWIWAEVSRRDQSSTAQLRVKELVINCTWTFAMGPESIVAFARWIALFLVLERLEVCGRFMKEGLDEKLRQAVLEARPGLKSFQLVK